ncbi:GntR family transcriptional regulator [Rhodovarius crocodyli]|uniref:GntR family transcriptional regulator n=1 Tax=Rhodovarius crocodyli TaxID=1979269 RepID=A0A437MDT3_9PROT|nr:GntR family transcriptional regulator [Rhodovarius crocodyli]RVT95743.1 GntR family transcriptional regulator [Rhodovarius crocodyli]
MRWDSSATDRPPSGVTAAEMVFRRLLHAIISGELADDTLETEERLAARYDVSRTPLRDAIRRLEQLRLLQREPKGLRIPALSMGEMHELSATREVLEGLLAASAARRVASGQASAARLKEIHARHQRVQALGDAELTLSVGLDFHEELRRLAANHSAAACHEQVMLGFERYRQLASRVPDRPGHIAEEHSEILDAIAAGDAPAAETAMRRHIAAGRELYLSVLSGTLKP